MLISAQVKILRMGIFLKAHIAQGLISIVH